MSTMDDFKKKVAEYFNFLILDFNFELEISNDRLALFRSEKCVIEVFHDRGQIFINIINPQDKEKYDLGHVINASDSAVDFYYEVNGLSCLDKELSRLKKYLLSYCKELLKGNFNISEKMNKYFEERKKSFNFPKKIGKSKIIYPDRDK